MVAIKIQFIAQRIRRIYNQKDNIYTYKSQFSNGSNVYSLDDHKREMGDGKLEVEADDQQKEQVLGFDNAVSGEFGKKDSLRNKGFVCICDRKCEILESQVRKENYAEILKIKAESLQPSKDTFIIFVYSISFNLILYYLFSYFLFSMLF